MHVQKRTKFASRPLPLLWFSYHLSLRGSLDKRLVGNSQRRALTNKIYITMPEFLAPIRTLPLEKKLKKHKVTS